MCHFFPKIKESAFVRAINTCLYSIGYIGLVVALMVVSNVFGLELPVYYTYTFFCVLSVLFADDLFPVMPMVCCGYMTFSKKNNPASAEGTLFATRAGQVQLIAMIAVIVVVLMARFVYEACFVRREKKMPRLTIGYVLLGIAYIFGGMLSPYYTKKTVIFGLVQIISISVFYFFFYYTVDWSKRKPHDFAVIFTAVGVGLTLEIVAIYCNPEVLQAYKDGKFERLMLATGWGIHNNLGGMMALFLPAPFCLAATKRNGWIYNLIGQIFFAALMFTQSRTSMVVGAGIYVLCMVCVLIFSSRKERFFNIAVYSLVGAVAILGFFLFWEKIYAVFSHVLSAGTDNHGRDLIYKWGMEQFREYPIFGNGFYECEAWQYGGSVLPEDGFLPPRYHNTIVQLLASGGVVAMCAYVLHRLQTVILVVRKCSVEKIFIFLSVLVITLTSLYDCHFFNMGPGLSYACLLVLAEKGASSRLPFQRKKKKKAQNPKDNRAN